MLITGLVLSIALVVACIHALLAPVVEDLSYTAPVCGPSRHNTITAGTHGIHSERRFAEVIAEQDKRREAIVPEPAPVQTVAVETNDDELRALRREVDSLLAQLANAQTAQDRDVVTVTSNTPKATRWDYLEIGGR